MRAEDEVDNNDFDFEDDGFGAGEYKDGRD
jgi:hypothetical protein